LSDHETARRIELACPQLGQRLSVYCDLQSRAEKWTEQQQALVILMEQSLEKDLTDDCVTGCFRERILHQPLLMVGLLACVFMLFGLGFRTTFAIASERTLIPWSFPQWPRRHELYVQNHQDKVVLDGDFKIQVGTRSGQLPRDVFVDVRWTSDQHVETLRLTRQADSFETVLHSIQKAFAYRIHGGDYSADSWREVATVIAPNVRSLQTQIWPPSYTQLASYQTAGSFRALAGSQIAVSAVVDQPVRIASMVVQVQQQQTRVALHVEPTDQGTRLYSDQKITVQQDGIFWLELQDLDSVHSRSKVNWNIRVVDDEAPQVRITAPTTETVITTTGVIPLEFQSSDDLQIQQLILQYCPGKEWLPDHIYELEMDPTAFLVGGRPVYSSARVFHQQSPDRLHIRTGLNLTTLPEVTGGSTILLRVTVRDGLDQVTVSDRVALSVLSLEQYRARMRQEITIVAEQLRKLQERLQLESELAGSYNRRLRDRDDLDIDLLWRELVVELQLRHRSNASVLQGNPSSIVNRLDFIGRTLSGEVALPVLSDVHQRFQLIAMELYQQTFPQIQIHMSELMTEDSGAVLQPRELRIQSVDEIVRMLDQAVQQLSSVLQQQTVQQAESEFMTFWREMITEQENLLGRVRRLHFDRLSNRNTPQPKDAQILARQQRELADGVAQHVIRITVPSEHTQPVQSDLAQSLSDLPVIPEMRLAARLLSQEEFARAMDQQEEVIAEMRDWLAGFGGTDTENRQQQMAQIRLQESFKSIYRAESVILAQLDEAPADGPVIMKLASDQDRLIQRTSNLIGMKSTSAIMRLSLQTVLMQMKHAHTNFSGDRLKSRGHLVQVLELLERMIPVAGSSGTPTQGEENLQGDDSLNRISVQDLELIRTIQQDLNDEVQRLVHAGILSDVSQKKLDALIRRQKELQKVVAAYQRVQGDGRGENQANGKDN